MIMKQRNALSLFTSLYPVWILGFSTTAIVKPETLLWFHGLWVVWALTLVMLGIGLTLTVNEKRWTQDYPLRLAAVIY
jgi:BASS family bile acid:Na+ symporter